MSAGGGISTDAIDAMVQAGATVEVLAALWKAEIAKHEKRAEERRSKDRVRQSRHRESRDVTVTKCDPPNDIYSNPQDKPSPSGDGQKPSSEIDQVVSAWNAMAKRTGLQRIVKLNAARRRSAKARLAEYGLQAMLDAVARIERSDFCCGKTGSWKGATFDFLVSDTKFLRLIEGTYDNHGEGAAPAKPLTEDEQRARQLSTAETYERIGRTEEAAEIRRRWATGPPGQPVGNVVAGVMARVGKSDGKA